MPTSSDESKKVDRAAPTKQVVAQTKAQRNISIQKDRTGRFWSIKIEEGGELAPELRGTFTSQSLALNAIEQYKHRKGL